MMSPNWLVLKDFLESTPKDIQDRLYMVLENDTLEDLENIPAFSFSPSSGFENLSDRLSSIHYSWFLPFFDRLKDSDKYFFVSALNEHQKASIMKFYDLTRLPKELSPIAKNYILQILYSYLNKDNHKIIPKNCLPEDPLNNLLNLTREQLLTLVDYLSMHDLSLELKTMISATHLNNIENLLPIHQRQYLKILSQKIEPISFRPMGLSHWDGNESQFRKILHQRGLNRLSKALTASHHSLLWHLSHKLDIGRASIVKTLYKEIKNKKAQRVLVTQVCDIIDKVH
jgi:hypothetical protein